MAIIYSKPQGKKAGFLKKGPWWGAERFNRESLVIEKFKESFKQFNGV